MRCSFKDINKVIRVAEKHGNGEDVWLAFSYALQNEDVYILMPDDDSLFFFRDIGDNEFDVHMIGTFESLKKSFEWIFANTNCTTISAVAISDRLDRWGRMAIKKLGGTKENNKYIVRRKPCLQ